MIKKVLPIIALLGASALIVGISNSPKPEKVEAIYNNINSFSENVNDYVSTNTTLASTTLNKYLLNMETPNLDDKQDNSLHTLDEKYATLEIAEDEYTEDMNEEKTETTDEKLENEKNSAEQISTLYSLSSDIEDSCDYFCELKQDISKAIIETQNLINKVKEKEIELSDEQRLLITEQARQLKTLGRQLSNVTTELSFNLSDLNQIMATNGGDFDTLSLKYLVVLDNLVNGNEMLQSGLNSLNLINQMFNMRTNNIPSNNTGRVLYGFRHNNNPPVVKDYYFDENGTLIENSQDENMQNESENNSSSNSNSETVSGEKKSNIDSYQSTELNSNLDTYNNNNLPHNIDTFFNTALLDNEFMYGNGNYGYGYGGMNGNYLQRNSRYGFDDSAYGASNQNNTQNEGNMKNTNTPKNSQEKQKKRFRLKNNIDTFKDENEPSIKTKLGNIKNSISGFLGKFKRSGLDDKIDNPIYRYDPNNSERNS